MRHDTSPLSLGEKRIVDVNAVEEIVGSTLPHLKVGEELDVYVEIPLRISSVFIVKLGGERPRYSVENDRVGEDSTELDVPVGYVEELLDYVEENEPGHREFLVERLVCLEVDPKTGEFA